MHDPALEIVDATNAPSGAQGTKVLTLRSGPVVFRAKWRMFDGISLVSDPRKELGAYAVQRLFLSAGEYVIPPAAGHCFEIQQYRARVDGSAEPFAPPTACVFGILSYWLPDAHDVDEAEDLDMLRDDSLYDAELFRSDPVYRRSLANLNLSAYLVHHADAHDEQFLAVDDSGSTRVYSVDNSMAFQSITNPMVWFREDWATLRVPWIPGSSCRRLKAIDQGALDSLLTIEEFELNDGQLSYRAPRGAAVRADDGLRWLGKRLEVGLTRGEIDGVRSRLEALTSRLTATKTSDCALRPD